MRFLQHLRPWTLLRYLAHSDVRWLGEVVGDLEREDAAGWLGVDEVSEGLQALGVVEPVEHGV